MKNIVSFVDGKLEFTPGNIEPIGYNLTFCAKTLDYRIKAGYDDLEQFAVKLHLSPEIYKQYEIDTPLPHHLINEFCILTGANPWDLFVL